MISSHTPRARRGALPVLIALAILAFPSLASAAPTVGLGVATSFTVLAGTPSIDNTGPTIVTGDMGIAPAVAVNGFGGPPDGTVIGGAIHAGDALADGAKFDLVTAYDDAQGRADTLPPLAGDQLDGMTLQPGVYSGGALELAVGGTLTLDGQGDPNAVFIIRASSSLTTFAGSTVDLIGDAQSCNVFWAVTSSATLGTNSEFVGSILALSDISALTGATIDGRLLARNGQVTLDANRITRSDCAAVPPIVVPPVVGPPVVVPPVDGGGGGNVPVVNPNPPTPVVPRGVIDTTRPTVMVLVPRSPCVTSSFVTRIAIRDRNFLRSARVYVDGRFVANVRRGTSRVTIAVRGLRAGSHRLRVVAVDRAGNSRVVTASFGRCAHVAAAGPRYTG